jgi:hypothetical protein
MDGDVKRKAPEKKSPQGGAGVRQPKPPTDDPFAHFEEVATALFQVPKDEIAPPKKRTRKKAAP